MTVNTEGKEEPADQEPNPSAYILLCVLGIIAITVVIIIFIRRKKHQKIYPYENYLIPSKTQSKSLSFLYGALCGA